MSLYNLLHGENRDAKLLLGMLGIDQGINTKYQSGRYRDIYLNADGTEIILFTRNGGGNREQYQPIIDELAKHPNYLRDYDDDFDCTFAYIIFSVPDDFKELCKSNATGEIPETLKEKSDRIIAEMEGMTKEQIESDPRFKPMTDSLKKMFESGEGGIITV